MESRVRDLPSFFHSMAMLLETVDSCSPVLFRRRFRENLKRAIPEVTEALRLTAAKLEDFEYYAEHESFLRAAGLTDRQLELKLEAFSATAEAFDEEGHEENLEKTLDFGSTILSSAAGAIPGIGSFVQELVDFILKEIRRRWRFWRR